MVISIFRRFNRRYSFRLLLNRNDSLVVFGGFLDVLPAFNSCVRWLRLIVRDCPAVADFYRARYAFLVAQDLYAPGRDTPPLGGLGD